MRILLLTALSVAGLLAPSIAQACSCGPAPAPAVALEGADLVFEGTVSAVPVTPEDGAPMRGSSQVEYRFNVARAWKGTPGMELRVLTNASSAACGRRYDKGATYIVYASMDEEASVYDTLCSRTRLSKDGAEDLAALGEGAPPRARGGVKAIEAAGSDAGATAVDGDDGATEAPEPDGAEPTEALEPASAPEAPEATPAVVEAPADDGDDEITKKSCAYAPASPSLAPLAMLAGLALGRRRRR